MAIAVDAASAGDSLAQDDPATLTYSKTVSSGSNFLCVGVIGSHTGATTPDVSSVTYDGGANMTEILELMSGTDHGVWLFREEDPPATTANVVVTFNATMFRGRSGCQSFSGVDTASPEDGTATNSGTSAATTISITPSVDGCLIFDVFHHLTNDTTPTESDTSVWEGELGAGNDSCGSQYVIQGTAASDTLTWDTGTSAGWLAAVVAIAPAATGWGPLLSVGRNRLVTA